MPADRTVEGACAPFFVPVLSIIIPVHNQWQYTRACLASLLCHPPSVPFEILVVDDGSSDETKVRLAQWSVVESRITTIRSSPPHRFARASNCGARQATGQYLLFLNNDIEIQQADWHRPLHDLLEVRTDIGIVAPLLLFPDGSVQHCGKLWHMDADGLPRPAHDHYGQPLGEAGPPAGGSFFSVTGACIMVRREQFFAFGPFDEQYENGWEDDDLCLSFRAKGLQSWVCTESRMIHHQGGTLKAEAVVLERYLNLLRNKGVSLSSDDQLLAGIAERAREQAERFEASWRRNRQHFVHKWGNSLQKLLSDAQPAATDPGLSRATTIIIVTYNSAATIDACLDSIAATIRLGDVVIVIDNASRDTTLEKVQARTGVLPLTVVANHENRGYAAAGNLGIKLARTPFVVLLNPDTVVTTGWMDRLQNHFTGSSIAAVGPVSNFAAGRQSVACHWHGRLPDGIAPDQAAARLATMNRGRSERTALLIGFCLMLRRTLPDCSVFMDERLFLGNDDLELSWRLRLRNYDLLIAQDCFVYHEGQHSFRSDSETVTGALVQESSTALYRILETCYGRGRVPTPEQLWNIDWFCAEGATWNDTTRWDQIIFQPQPWTCPELLVSLVILTFNQWSYTEECLAAISKYTPEPHELLLVDNGSSDGTVDKLRRLAEKDTRITLILNPDNRGYAAGCNQGIQAARGEFIVLLNNDVIVTPEWLSGLLECHHSHPLAGIVGPMTNRASGAQVVTETGYEIPEGLGDFSRSFRIRNRFRYVPSRRIVGFCMLFHRALMEKTGLLDEQFGTGNYEDDDICLRAAVEGCQNLIAGDVFVHHHGSVSFTGNRIDYRSALTRNAAMFREKWSKPVTNPMLGARIEACHLKNDVEAQLLDEQVAVALSGILAGIEKFPDDLLLRELAATVQSVAGVTQAANHLTPGLRLIWKAREATEAGQRAYATALILAGFRLEPWRPEIISSLLACCQAGQDGLAVLADQAFRLYPSSRGLARLRVQLASAEMMPVTLDWAEEFLTLFGADDHVIAAGLKIRHLCDSFCRQSAAGPSVSLCMIVKDEEQNLARCLASCKPVVSEMVVVDTGSVDRTVPIAELFGARVLSTVWNDDFATARNLSIEKATGDWLLIMDADEALSARDHAAFTQLLAGADTGAAYTLTTRNYTTNSALEGFIPCLGEYPENEAGSGWTPSDKVRLFPNGCGIHFTGNVHEMLEPSIQATGLSVRKHPVPVHHYGGLDQERLARKRSEYLNLGLKKLEQQPDDPKALYELAVQAAELQRFDIAALLWRELLKSQPGFAKGWFNLGYALLNQDKFEEARQASEQSLLLDPELRDAEVNKALCEACLYSRNAAWESAEKALERYPGHPVIMALAALALYRTGRTREGRQLTWLLAGKRVQCRPLYERIRSSLLISGSAEELSLIRQAIDELPSSS